MIDHQIPVSHSSRAAMSCSRRSVLRRIGGLAGLFISLPAPSVPAHAALMATVAPPLVVRSRACRATVTVRVTLIGIRPGATVEVGGDVVETDDPDGAPDPCLMFPPRVLRVPDEQPHHLLLTREAMAAELGLVKGVGPAADETYSPDLVELVARVWLREAETGQEHGPWLSPTRVTVASAALAWTPDDQLLTNTLLGSQGWNDRREPPQACAP
jgi:hypothetical protein